MKAPEHFKAVADQIARDLYNEYGSIAPHIIGAKEVNSPIDTLLLTVAESLKEMSE